MDVKGKRAVVVGGASGMARATAELLSERGATVAILDLPTSAGAEVEVVLLGEKLEGVDHLDAIVGAEAYPSDYGMSTTLPRVWRFSTCAYASRT